MAGALSASATVTVTGSIGKTGNDVVSLTVIPGSQAVAFPRQATQFLAIGTTASGATQDLTGQVAWTSSSTAVATIGATGFATGVDKGTTTITAIVTNPEKTVATGSATFTVAGGTTEQFTAVTILPGNQSLSASGQTSQFVALATVGASGLQQDVTSSPQIKWSSNVPTIASVNSSGLATGVAVGSATITAVLTNPDSTAVSASASAYEPNLCADLLIWSDPVNLISSRGVVFVVVVVFAVCRAQGQQQWGQI